MAVTKRSAPDVDDYLTDDEDTEETTSVDYTSVSDVEAAFEPEDETEIAARSSAVQSGWGSAKKAMATSGKGYTKEFKFSEEPQLVKFLDGEPFAVYAQHWLNEKEGRKSYVCLGSKCPLCNVLGHSPSKKIAFSIVNFGAEGTDEDPEIQVLAVGPRFAGQLERFHADRKKTGPLDGKDRYWAISKTGTGTSTVHNALPVKERDLADDYDLSPEQANAFLSEAEPFDSSAIRVDRYDDLLEIARDLAA